jgi:NitT/TauT family transport system substrate-binding protein
MLVKKGAQFMKQLLTKMIKASVGAAILTFGLASTSSAEVGFGKPGQPVNLVIGYQPYYTESWSGVVINGKDLWKKYLPKGSTAKFEIGLQGSVIVGKLLGEKNHIGYMGDMPAIVSSMREKQVDLRMISVLGTSKQQCNIFLVPNNAPKFKSGMDAVKWMNGKLIAAPHGACTDRFALLAFEQAGIKPSKYLNMNIENITKNLEAGKIAGAAIWEPTASKIEMAGIARRGATGADFAGDDAGDAGFLVMMNEIIQTRPDVHRGWLEAELDAQLFLADLGNANAVSKMADDQTEGIKRKVLWASLYRDENKVNKLTLDFIFNDKVTTMLKASTAFLAKKKKFGKRKALRPESVWDDMARKILKERGLKSPLGKIDGVPLSQYKN